MKVTVLKDKKPNTQLPEFLSSIFLFILGILLIFNSDGLISFIFTILGAFVILYGISKFLRYYQLKNQLHVDQPDILISAISVTFVGLLVVLLSNILVSAIKIVTGIWLFFVGISKLNHAIALKGVNSKQYFIELFSAIILLLLGFYTIFAKNVVLVFLGIVLIFYAGADLMKYFFQKKA
jgi:uncharacterized membrane protein HdeD (DUF308 family)